MKTYLTKQEQVLLLNLIDAEKLRAREIFTSKASFEYYMASLDKVKTKLEAV